MPLTALTTVMWLRWSALAGVVTLLALVDYWDVLSIWPSSWWYIAAFALSNLVLWRAAQRATLVRLAEWVVCAVLCADLGFLYLLLWHHGGAHNPFSILAIAIGSVAAMYLPRRSLVVVLGAAWLMLGGIYGRDMPEAMHHQMHDPQAFTAHLQGMWLANSLGVLVVCWWIWRLRTRNEASVVQQQTAERMVAHLERLDSMGRMVAATAHTLNTPLATLQLGISELRDTAQPLTSAERAQWLEDLQVAVTRIRDVVQQLLSVPSSDQAPAPAVALEVWLHELIGRWSALRRVPVAVRATLPEGLLVSLDLPALGRVLEALLENAAAAAVAVREVQMTVDASMAGDWLQLAVHDCGHGMDAATVARATEPLFTTKKNGTGLGLYLCHALMQRWGGRLQIDSALGQGTTVCLAFPRQVAP